MQTVAVVGATGVYGRHLVPRLVARGRQVRVLVRDPARATLAVACGAEVRRADLFDLDALRAGLMGCDVVVNLATAVPRPDRPGGDFAANDRLRREGTPILLAACRATGVERVLQQSIAMVNGAGDAWGDEETALPVAGDDPASAAIAAARAMEESVRASTVDWVVLRGGLFYGPGTGLDDDWRARARAGTLRVPGDGGAWVSLVHVADMAEATVRALERWPSRRALIVADDRPVAWWELFAWVAAREGGAPLLVDGRLGFPSFRLRNARAREALAWQPFHRDYRSGLAA